MNIRFGFCSNLAISGIALLATLKAISLLLIEWRDHCTFDIIAPIPFNYIISVELWCLLSIGALVALFVHKGLLHLQKKSLP